MNWNHRIETLLNDIGAESVPQDVHQLAESITDAFRQSVSGDLDAVPHESQASKPAVRLVPDVPTELADGISCETHPIEQPPDRRHERWRFVVTMFQHRSVRWSMAAAAAVIVIIAFWPSNYSRRSGNGVVWADVVQQLAAVKNVTYWIEPHYVSADGKPGHLRWYRMYHQDPGLMRREYYSKADVDFDDAAPKPPDQRETPLLRNFQVRQIKIAGEEQQWYFIDPIKKTINHEVTYGYQHDSASQVEDWWDHLHDITSNEANKIGEEFLNGKPVTVFEAIVDKPWGYPSHKGEVTNCRIWIENSTFLPVRMQFSRTAPNSTYVEQAMEDMRWNLDLPADFFTPPADYTLVEHYRNYYLPEGTQLKDGVRIRLYDEKGFEIFNETQIEHVSFMRASAQGIVTDVHFNLSIQNLWQQIWPKIQGDLYYDFNREILAAKYGPWQTHSFPRNYEVSKLGLTVEQFQMKYLVMPQ